MKPGRIKSIIIIAFLALPALSSGADERYEHQRHYQQLFSSAESFESELQRSIISYPDDIVIILSAALAVQPERTQQITQIALQIAPWLSEQIVNTVVGILPNMALAIVTLAVNSTPENADRIVKGAISAVLDPAYMVGDIVATAIRAQPNQTSLIIAGAIAANRDETYVRNVLTAAVATAPQFATQIEQQAISLNIDPQIVTQASASGQVPSSAIPGGQSPSSNSTIAPVQIPGGGDGGGVVVSGS